MTSRLRVECDEGGNDVARHFQSQDSLKQPHLLRSLFEELTMGKIGFVPCDNSEIVFSPKKANDDDCRYQDAEKIE